MLIRDAYEGRPVRQGRAPLRQRHVVGVGGRDGDVVPSAKDGLHCGPSGVVSSSFSSSRVVPSAKDGLHCGMKSGGGGWSFLNVVPSAKDGLHCGCASLSCRTAIACVVPSAKDGLHCGEDTGAAPR